MQLTAIVFGISSFFWVLVVITDTATLSLPISANCGDQAEMMCTSTSCNRGYSFTRGSLTIYNFGGPQSGTDPARYSTTVLSDTQVQLTITNIQLSDNGTYACSCGFDTSSAVQTLQYECKATACSTNISPAKKLNITVDRLYPNPSIVTAALINPTSQLLFDRYTCVQSPTFASHFMCTLVSKTSLYDGDYSYNITVTTRTTAFVTGSFRIVTATSPTISNLVPISNNRQVLRGVQDTPLTIQCVSRGGIPAPTLAWYRGNTSTSSLAQSTTSDYVLQPDGTYTVNLSHRFTPSRTDDLTPLLCRVFYPGATTGASPDPSSASVLLYLDLKPDITSVSQTGEAVSGGSITLRCTSTKGRPAPSIKWSFKRRQNLTSINTSYDQTSETYTVESVFQTSVSAMDNGQNVTCMVSHTTLPAPLNGTAKLDVKFGPRPNTAAISGNKTIPATGTNMIQLNCTSGSSNPACNITWYNGSDLIANTNGYTRWHGDNNGVVTSTILTITPTRYMDGNKLVCRPDNGYGNDSLFVDLDILYPCLLQTIPNVTAIEGEPDVTLTCSASSKPPANFTWYKGSMVLANGIGSLTSNTFSYLIPRVDRSYGGSYTCHASNNIGSPDSKEAYLIVKYPPTVTVSTTTSPAYTVSCKAEGNPDSFTYQEWVQIWPGYGPVATLPFTETLTLANDTYERSGVYVCGASNGVAVYGMEQKYMHGNETVLIQAPPILTDPSPDGARVHVAGRLYDNSTTSIKYWSNVNDSVVRCYKRVGDTRLSFSGCSVTETVTEVTLSVYNHVVNETGKLATVKIPIRSLEDFTDYYIVVTNRKGELVLGITIVPEGPPAAPTITDNIVVTTGKVILTVVPGFHGGYNQTLVVQISTDLIRWTNSTSVNVWKNNMPIEVRLDNLKGSALHYVHTFSYNIEGRSNSSEIFNFTTAEDASVPSPPTAALIGGTVGASCAFLIVVVIVIIVLRNRKVELNPKATDESYPANEQNNLDIVVECAMYASAGNVQSGPSVTDVYATAQKKRHSEQARDVYAVVSKKKKGSAHVSKDSETVFGHHPTSNRHQIPKKNLNDDGIIYANPEFDKSAKYDVIHGLDPTVYVEIDFTRTAEPLPESDEESTDTK